MSIRLDLENGCNVHLSSDSTILDASIGGGYQLSPSTLNAPPGRIVRLTPRHQCSYAIANAEHR